MKLDDLRRHYASPKPIQRPKERPRPVCAHCSHSETAHYHPRAQRTLVACRADDENGLKCGCDSWQPTTGPATPRPPVNICERCTESGTRLHTAGDVKLWFCEKCGFKWKSKNGAIVSSSTP